MLFTVLLLSHCCRVHPTQHRQRRRAAVLGPEREQPHRWCGGWKEKWKEKEGASRGWGVCGAGEGGTSPG
jgi:hypothetical protein